MNVIFLQYFGKHPDANPTEFTEITEVSLMANDGKTIYVSLHTVVAI